MMTNISQGVRERLAALHAAGTAAAPSAESTTLNAATAPLGVDEDDDDYEPDLTPAEDTEQILNKLDNAPPEEPIEQAVDTNTTLSLGPFKLPPPPELNPDLAAQLSQAAASRVFAPLASLKDAAPAGAALRRPKAGINRLAASSLDRDSWLTVITRLATRSTAGLDEDFDEDDGDEVRIKAEEETTAVSRVRPALGDAIREMLYNYILEDWRRRIDVAVAWLCEEWYCDQMAKRKRAREGKQPPPATALNYEKWTMRVLDALLGYVTGQDKVLTRFLAEIPELNRAMLGRLKGLCADPTTVQLALTSLLYLVMMRPPVREMALDVVGEIWVECEYLSIYFFLLMFFQTGTLMLTICFCVGRRGRKAAGAKVSGQVAARVC